MTERRYIIGSRTNPAYALRSTALAPVQADDGLVRFPSNADGTGTALATRFPVTRGCVSVKHAPSFIAVETDDQELVARIDAAKAAVQAAYEALRAARAEETEVLAVIAARCKPARVR